MSHVTKMRDVLDSKQSSSKWGEGVIIYAHELLDSYKERIDDGDFEEALTAKEFHEDLLFGAPSWPAYSYGACSLIWNEEIAKRLCTRREYRDLYERNGLERLGVTWLDEQARALSEAERILVGIFIDTDTKEVKHSDT